MPGGCRIPAGGCGTGGTSAFEPPKDVNRSNDALPRRECVDGLFGILSGSDFPLDVRIFKGLEDFFDKTDPLRRSSERDPDDDASRARFDGDPDFKGDVFVRVGELSLVRPALRLAPLEDGEGDLERIQGFRARLAIAPDTERVFDAWLPAFASLPPVASPGLLVVASSFSSEGNVNRDFFGPSLEDLREDRSSISLPVATLSLSTRVSESAFSGRLCSEKFRLISGSEGRFKPGRWL